MPRLLQPCGTRAAYKRHRAYGQVPCEPCSRANYEYDRRLRYKDAELNRDIRQLVHVLACALGVGRAL